MQFDGDNDSPTSKWYLLLLLLLLLLCIFNI